VRSLDKLNIRPTPQKTTSPNAKRMSTSRRIQAELDNRTNKVDSMIK